MLHLKAKIHAVSEMLCPEGGTESRNSEILIAMCGRQGPSECKVTLAVCHTVLTRTHKPLAAGRTVTNTLETEWVLNCRWSSPAQCLNLTFSRDSRVEAIQHDYESR
jgi:hypothetical protein